MTSSATCSPAGVRTTPPYGWGSASPSAASFFTMALASGEIDTRDFEFEHVLKDIQTLNLWALDGRLEVTALSLHAYPFVQDEYVPLPRGAVRQDPGGGLVGRRARRPAHPRGTAHLRRCRSHQDRRPRRVVAPRDRSAPAPRRERRAARPRRGHAARALRSAPRVDRGRPREPAARD